LKYFLLYVCTRERLEATKAALARLEAKPVDSAFARAPTWEIDHPLLQGRLLEVTLLADLDGITPHLRHFPVDLLIYDERPIGKEKAVEARAAISKIRDDVAAFAELWGPDFLFPMSRVVAILKGDPRNMSPGDRQADVTRSLELGRVQVRDVIVDPPRTAQLLRWIFRVIESHHTDPLHEPKPSRKGKRGSAPRAGIAFSGGGLEGFLFQTGCLHALEQALDTKAGRDLRDSGVYSGVSSGAIMAAMTAGGVPTDEVIKALHGKSQKLAELNSKILFDVAGMDIAKRIGGESLSWSGLDPQKWVNKIFRAFPTGFFKGEALKRYFKDAIEAYKFKDSFTANSDRNNELYIGATDQDSFEHVVFGKPPWDDVSISDALRASCALPPFFTPSRIKDRWFVDGQITKSCNVDLLIERGCRLVFIVDPLKPYGTLVPGSVDKLGGVYSTIQAVKALVSTRFHITLMHLTERYPDVDFIVFQPDEECAELMSGSPMRYRIRTKIVQLAYEHTMRQIRERHQVYQTKLEKYGFKLHPVMKLLELERDNARFFKSLD
jgi:predicted acylesterase/phospholipase RssA